MDDPFSTLLQVLPEEPANPTEKQPGKGRPTSSEVADARDSLLAACQLLRVSVEPDALMIPVPVALLTEISVRLDELEKQVFGSR